MLGIKIFMSMNKTNISVLIRTYNSEKTLENVIKGIGLKANDELIIVDSGSNDNTISIAKSYGAVIRIAPPPFNYSKSLNIGFRTAENPWVLVLSSHSIPLVSDFIEIYRKCLSTLNHDVVVAYGPSTITGESCKIVAENIISVFDINDYPEVEEICGNANTIYRSSAWSRCPFNENIRTGEDRIWIHEMISQGYKFAYVPNARTKNDNHASFIYMFVKGMRDARAIRKENHIPMKVRYLLGGIKNHIVVGISNKSSIHAVIRLCMHITGQFLGSHMSENNTTINGGS